MSVKWDLNKDDGGENMILENIRRLCLERNISIAELERKSGLNNATICKWANSMPRVDTLKKVADALGVSMDDLMKAEE